MGQVTFQNSRNKTLVGNLLPARSKSVIIMAHAFANDRSSQGRFDQLSRSFYIRFLLLILVAVVKVMMMH